MRAGFTRFFAWAMIVSGVFVILIGGLLALLAWQIPPERLALPPTIPRPELTGRVGLSVVCVGLGFMAGAPLVVFGQLMLVFLDMRRHLARIERRLRRRQRPAERVSPQAERFLSQRPPTR